LVSLGAFLQCRIIEPIRRAQGTPESIARGGALGLWVALTPTVGVQSLVVTALAVPLRANLPVSLVMCWITNPITLVPFYFAYYWLGTMMLGGPADSYLAIGDLISQQFNAMSEVGFVASMRPLGSRILWPMCVGSLVLASVVALPTYHVLLWFFRRRQRDAGAVSEGEAVTVVQEAPAKSEP
jgi:uncharacterized protein (DUF2062 family)